MAYRNFQIPLEKLDQARTVLINNTCREDREWIIVQQDADTVTIKMISCFKCRVLFNFYFGEHVLRRF